MPLPSIPHAFLYFDLSAASECSALLAISALQFLPQVSSDLATSQRAEFLSFDPDQPGEAA
jgi:hypothetical protein